MFEIYKKNIFIEIYRLIVYNIIVNKNIFEIYKIQYQYIYIYYFSTNIYFYTVFLIFRNIPFKIYPISPSTQQSQVFVKT